MGKCMWCGGEMDYSTGFCSTKCQAEYDASPQGQRANAMVGKTIKLLFWGFILLVLYTYFTADNPEQKGNEAKDADTSQTIEQQEI